jgi:hypothetical protein
MSESEAARMTEKNLDHWSRMYQEQVVHARHHETLRAQSTNLIVVVSATLLAFLASNAASPGRQVVLGVFLIAVNAYGLLMSLKHYERSRLHVTVASRYRDVLSENTAVGGQTLNEARASGHQAHSERFPISFVASVRAYVMWSGLHVLLALIGGFVAFYR